MMEFKFMFLPVLNEVLHAPLRTKVCLSPLVINVQQGEVVPSHLEKVLPRRVSVNNLILGPVKMGIKISIATTQIYHDRHNPSPVEYGAVVRQHGRYREDLGRTPAWYEVISRIQ
jgi:hypothetical protein